jgi:Wzt-like putative exopolysaccharide export protein
MADIKLFCTKAIVLHRGRVAFAGEPEAAIKAYEGLQFPPEKSEEERRAAVLAPAFHNSDVLSGVEHYWCDAGGNRISSLRSGDTAYFKVSFESSIDIRNLVLGVPVWSEAGTYVTGFSTELGPHRYSIEKGSRATFVLKVPALGFNPGGYISNISILDGAEFLYRRPNPPLQVAVNQSRYWGVYTQAHEWQRHA